MGEFQHGLFGCFDNCGMCIMTWFLPCITAGRNAEAVGESCMFYGCMSLFGPFGIYFGAKIRSQIRESKGIEGSFGMDCLLHWFCPLCAYVQEAQEVQGGGEQAADIERE